MAYVGEEMHRESMDLAMGPYVGGNAIGGMSGRLLTVVISDLWGWRTAILVMGILGSSCGLILWCALPASRHFVASEPRLPASVQTFRLHLSDPALRRLFAEGFLLMGSFVTLYNYISYRLLAPPFSLSHTTAGLIFAIYLFGSAWIGDLAAKIGRLQLFLARDSGDLDRKPAHVIGPALADYRWSRHTNIWLFCQSFDCQFLGGARPRQAKAQASSLYLLAYYLGSSIAGSAGVYSGRAPAARE